MEANLIRILVLLCLTAYSSHARFVTVTVSTNAEESIIIADGEIAKVASFHDDFYDSSIPYGNALIRISKNGGEMDVSGQSFHNLKSNSPIIIAGPARIRLISNFPNRGASALAFLTLELTPDMFSPDKTVALPNGQSATFIALESSTNLVEWATATNGVYSGTNGFRFFRIKAERLP